MLKAKHQTLTGPDEHLSVVSCTKRASQCPKLNFLYYPFVYHPKIYRFYKLFFNMPLQHSIEDHHFDVSRFSSEYDFFSSQFFRMKGLFCKWLTHRFSRLGEGQNSSISDQRDIRAWKWCRYLCNPYPLKINHKIIWSKIITH